MERYLVTCQGYKTERKLMAGEDAQAACLAQEILADDGYARIVMAEGRIIADADGNFVRGGHRPDAATQTGMYDRGDC
jgi:hypothetical protein